MPPAPAPDDLQSAADVYLVRAVADRHDHAQQALAELFDRFSPVLLGLVRRVLRQNEESEEILQEVFLHVWNHADRYNPQRSSVSTWLVLIARSRAIDRLRSRRVADRTAQAAHREDGRDHTSAESASRVLQAERRERMRAELALLPEEQREVLELAFYGGLTQREIAERTGTPLGTVKTRTLLAMKKLRKALRHEIRELL